MKILFVAGGNCERLDVPSLVRAQGESLIAAGVTVDYFPIVGRGFIGYLANVWKLRRFLKNRPVDIIHAHFSYSGVVASLATNKTPIVVSLLGSDVNSSGFFARLVLKTIPIFSWKAVIVKSEEMKKKLGNVPSLTIPNGVNVRLFKSLNKLDCKKALGLDLGKRHVLFLANPNRPEKNYALARDAVNIVDRDDLELIFLKNVEHEEIPLWLNAADLVVLSSLWEGSPNVIKEAMACNRPIVSTKVGDIAWLFGKCPGHFVATFEVEDFSSKINLALTFSEEYEGTSARERIFKLGLDSESVAKDMLAVYKRVI